MTKSALPVCGEKWLVTFVVGRVGSDSFLVISKKSFGMTKPAPPRVVGEVVRRVCRGVRGERFIFGHFKKVIRND